MISTVITTVLFEISLDSQVPSVVFQITKLLKISPSEHGAVTLGTKVHFTCEIAKEGGISVLNKYKSLWIVSCLEV